MHRDHDFDLQDALPPNEAELVHDLDLNTLFTAMANRDEFLYRVSKIAVLSGLSDPDDIAYRQQVLVDCLAHPEVVRQIYAVAIGDAEPVPPHHRNVSWVSQAALRHR
jgi:hypothetical protein